MEYEVHQVIDDPELVYLHQVSGDWDPNAQACAGFNQPPLEDLRAAYRVYAAYATGEAVALVLCSERRMFWLAGHQDHLATACVALADVIQHEFAPAWGAIQNAELRAAIAAASDGRIEDDGENCRWIGD